MRGRMVKRDRLCEKVGCKDWRKGHGYPVCYLICGTIDDAVCIAGVTETANVGQKSCRGCRAAYQVPLDCPWRLEMTVFG